MENIHKQFSSLEFRTELLPKDKGFTTQILEAYRMSFESYLQNNALSFNKENNLYKIKCNPDKNKISFTTNQNKPDGNFIINDLLKTYSSKDSNVIFDSIFDLKESDISLLPLISWLRNHDNKERKNFSFYYKEALSICQNLGGNL